MNIFGKLRCRTYQFVLRVAMHFMPWREPNLLQGVGSFDGAVEFLSSIKINRPLVVCDEATLERRALDGFFESANGTLQCFVYGEVMPNPTVNQVEKGVSVYLQNNCDGIVAFGGGSAMDCAKGIGARIARPQKSLKQMKGLLKVRRRLPPLVAVPTTSGTGSECTVAAVITDPVTQDKYAINDFCLIPHYAIEDPLLTVNLPQSLTATTGMDALTHAIEAYIGRSNTKQTKRQAMRAVQLVLDNIEIAFRNGANLTARQNMQQAAYIAGLAFTRAFVGYVHAMAHALGGKYNIPHGLANAVLLPVVLQNYGKSVHKSLAELSRATGTAQPSDSNRIASQKFVQRLFQLNEKLGLPRDFGGKIQAEHLEELSLHAAREGNPLYPVPKLWTAKDFQTVFEQVM